MFGHFRRAVYVAQDCIFFVPSGLDALAVTGEIDMFFPPFAARVFLHGAWTMWPLVSIDFPTCDMFLHACWRDICHLIWWVLSLVNRFSVFSRCVHVFCSSLGDWLCGPHSFVARFCVHYFGFCLPPCCWRVALGFTPLNSDPGASSPIFELLRPHLGLGGTWIGMGWVGGGRLRPIKLSAHLIFWPYRIFLVFCGQGWLLARLVGRTLLPVVTLGGGCGALIYVGQ